jgi:hypothetical protein
MHYAAIYTCLVLFTAAFFGFWTSSHSNTSQAACYAVAMLAAMFFITSVYKELGTTWFPDQKDMFAVMDDQICMLAMLSYFAWMAGIGIENHCRRKGWTTLPTIHS